ncbi:MAG: glycosyltransferase, partial [Kiritimatiellae bacterium]|nr:glycosyltransferase [Kiritimatiellia bacterium]
MATDTDAAKALTLIVPAYNMERYLDACCRSVVVPDDLMPRLEVLVVNDGSTDRTSEIGHS